MEINQIEDIIAENVDRKYVLIPSGVFWQAACAIYLQQRKETKEWLLLIIIILVICRILIFAAGIVALGCC